MPRAKSPNKYVHRTFKLPQELAERLDRFVAANYANRSLVVRMAIAEYIKRHADDIAAALPEKDKAPAKPAKKSPKAKK